MRNNRAEPKTIQNPSLPAQAESAVKCKTRPMYLENLFRRVSDTEIVKD